MTSPLSPERASEIIGGIYDCVLAPSKWDLVLARICEELELANALLGVLRLPQGIQIHQSIVGMPPDWLAAAPAYNEEIMALWGGPQRIQEYPLDEPVIQSEAVGQDAMEANRYFREQVRPRGMIDAVAFPIVREPNALGNVAFGRHGSYGKIDDQVMSGLRLLAPHFRRAIAISNLFDMQAIEASTFRSALDAVTFGLMVVDDELRILHSNATAEAMLAAGSPLRTHGGMLAVQPSSAEAVLLEAVTRAARDETTIGQKGIGVPLGGTHGDGLVLHVLPLRRGPTRPGLVPSATAAVFIAPAARPPQMPLDALTLLYDLTPAESRVFELIAAAMTADAIGETLGIATSTVKSHLLHVYEKTGCHRRIDLVRLAARLSLPV